MSVMKCDRTNCSTIICNRLILNGTHYICNECYLELMEFKTTLPERMTENALRQSILNFMASSKGSFKMVNVTEAFDKML